MSNSTPGLFVPRVDWSDPRFSRWNLSKLNLPTDLMIQALEEDDDIDIKEIREPTEKDRIELCRNVPCRVELGRSNVCTGVERGWPKRMFDVPDFKSLRPKQKAKIYADMERKAVFLYQTYVNEDRLERRRRRRTRNALALYYEQIFRRNRFQRYKALCELHPDTSLNYASDSDVSLQTVINTGSTQNRFVSTEANNRKEIIDLNDNDAVGIGFDDDEERDIVNDISVHKINISDTNIEYVVDDDCDIETNDGIYADVLSESITVPTQDQNSDELPESRAETPQIPPSDLVMNTPSFQAHFMNVLIVRDPLLEEDDTFGDEDQEIDSIDFLSQGMIGITSTQQ